MMYRVHRKGSWSLFLPWEFVFHLAFDCDNYHLPVMAVPNDHVFEKPPFNAVGSADSSPAPDLKVSESPADTSNAAETARGQQLPGPFQFALVTFSLCLIIFVITLVGNNAYVHISYPIRAVN